MRFLFFFKFIILFSLLSPSFSSYADNLLNKEIQEIFPKATVIGEKDKNFPVYPVYQLNELIGYAFQSNDLVDLPGFSGDTINMLIGIDTSGLLTGLKVLYHHEPIFLHGLGPEPMLSFIDQYVGRRVSDRIIVGSGRNSSSGTGNDTVYFDGVSKATVSVIVMNDIILSSALQVARKKLSEFAQQTPAVAKPDSYEPLSWQQLLSSNYVKHWTLTRADIESKLSSALNEYSTDEFAEEIDDDNLSDNNRINIFYGYLNAPSIGRNLLGEEEFQRLIATLKPNEHAIAIMSDGFYSYLESRFRPGTVPERISLQQNNLPITIRDLNFYNYTEKKLADGISNTGNLQIFKINNQSGFDPSAPMSLVLNMRISKNHLVTDEVFFTDEYHLPEVLFNKIEIEAAKPFDPVWMRIWKGHVIDIIIVLLALTVLSIAFLKQKALSKKTQWFHKFRWGFLFFTLFYIGWYAQGQLSVVNIYTLLLELSNGFSIDVFLLDPVIFILWIYTAASLLLWGRGLFCGWLCPFGALQEMVSWVAKKVKFKQVKVAPKYHDKMILIKYLMLGILVTSSFFSLHLAEVLSEIEPFKTSITLLFIRSWPFVIYALILLGLGLFIHKFYCRYICPLGAGLAIIGKLHQFEWLNRRAECGSVCQLCRNRCEINAINTAGKIDYNECIQCLECIVIINDEKQCAISLLENKKRVKPMYSSDEVKIRLV